MNIPGVKNYAEHKSSAQKSIWHSMMMLSRFEEVSIKKCEFKKADLIAGEKDFYQFIKNIYKDMYADPAKYVIPVKEYDDYIKTKKDDSTFVKMHKTDAIECNLRNTFQQAIEFYPKYFYAMGLAADGICKKTFSLIISKSKYAKALSSLDKPHIRGENKQRLQALENLGIKVKEVDGKINLFCKEAPKMFLGLYVLCSAPESKFKYMNYLRLDYKGYYRGMPEIDDIKLTLPAKNAVLIDSIIKVLAEIKLKYKVKPLRSIISSHGWKVEYTLKGKNVFGFFAEPDYLAFYIYFNDAKNITQMSQKLENDSVLFKWFCDKFPERLCKCRSNRAVMFGSEKRRICGLSNRAEIINPDNDDLQKITTVIQMFRCV
ncbi:MAG: hypothetical protein LBI04_09365 [Treponema sp.]|jgi:hypothetical protein|nr:hypothetical protein [Treponema sp.]